MAAGLTQGSEVWLQSVLRPEKAVTSNAGVPL